MKQKHFFRRLLSVLLMIALPSLSYSYNIGDTFKMQEEFINGSTSVTYTYTCLVTSDNTVTLSKFAYYRNYGDYRGYDVTVPGSIQPTQNDPTTYIITEIGESAFQGLMGLTSIKLPSTLTEIGKSAFQGCRDLVSIDLPSTLLKIKESTFQDCTSLAYINLPNTLLEIEKYAFKGCTNLTSITKPQFLTLGHQAFCESGLTSVDLNLAMNLKSKYFSGREEFNDITNGNSTNALGSGSRWNCSRSLNVASVTNAFQAGGAVKLGTSSQTGSLTTVPLKAVNNAIFIVYIKVKGWNAAGNLLVDLTGFPQQTVAYSATMDDDFEKVTLEFKRPPVENPVLTISTPTSSKRCFIDEIGVAASEGFEFYKEPERASIGTDVFRDCKNLKTVTLSGDIIDEFYGRVWSGIPSNTFLGCSSLTSISIPEDVTQIGSCAFEGCSSLTSIKIPESVTKFEENAFQDCSSLTSISLPEGLKNIASALFWRCSSLTSIKIPESVTSIGSGAFKSCTSLTSISLPKNVEGIGRYVFADCSSLTSIISHLDPKSTVLYFPETFNELDDSTPLYSIPLYVPASLVDEYKVAAQWEGFSNILPIEGGITVSVGSEGLSTYCPPVGVDFSEAKNIVAYRAAVDGSTVTLTKADKVNAGEGVLLRSIEGGTVEENLPLDLNTEFVENAFVGVSKQTTIYETDEEDNTNFVLSKVNGTVGFYKAKQSGTTVDAGKAYLPVKEYDASAAIKGFTLVFEDGFATGIDIVDYVQEQASDYDTYYTIGGLPVKNPTQKGVYIKGGKKYIVK